VEDVLEITSLIEHGTKNELKQSLIDLLNDLVVVGSVGVRVGKDHLDNQRELLLEDPFNKLAGGTFWSVGLCIFSLITGTTVFGLLMLQIGILFLLPLEVILLIELEKVPQPNQGLHLAWLKDNHIGMGHHFGLVSSATATSTQVPLELLVL